MARNCTMAWSNAAQSNDYDEYDYTGAFGAINMMIQVVEDEALYLNICNTTDTINQGSSTKLDSCCTCHMTGFYQLKNTQELRVAVIFGNKPKL